ncbi:Catenin alpha-1, partial [Halocaridina rubra]
MKAETHWETSPVFRWNLKDLDIKTKSVQKTLEPLLMQVTTLVNTQGTTSKKKKGKSKRAHVLVAAVEAATAHFIEKGKEIVRDSPEISDQMNEAIADVHKSGAAMSMHSREFAEDPCSSMKRSSMVKAARQLLSAVTRLLILADMVDVHLLFNSLEDVELELEKVRNASSNNELMDAFRRFSLSLNNLLDHTARRQQEMMDPRLQDDLAAARATLNRSTTMLLTTSKAYIRHPELSAARANRDYVLAQVCQAIDIIKNGAQGELSSRSTAPLERAGELESALDSFDAQVVIDPLHFNEAYSRALLEDQLESIISGSALMADSSSTRSDRRHRIIEECDALRSALQDLLQEYMDNMENKEPSESLNQALGHIHTKTRDLRRHLRKSVVDHVSD